MQQRQYIFFSGKGGVGKTTMACATAVHYAEQGKKTLIITTDPASNLADVFETVIGHKITPLSIPNLWGMEIDPDKATEEYRERILAPLRAVMPEDVMKVLEEQFSSPCTTEIASFDRFVDFVVADETTDQQDYDVVIFDTAPTGHTIRLLQLPVDWSKHIEESAKGSGNTCIGPVASIQENKHKYDKATRLLGDPQRTMFMFVLQPEGTSLYETLRSSRELQEIGVKHIELIVNGILPDEVCEHPFFVSRHAMQQTYLKKISASFMVPRREMYQRDGEIKGIDALRSVAADLFAENGKPKGFRLPIVKAIDDHVALEISPDRIEEIIVPTGQTRTVFFTGKGGVGKTVVSCAVAVHLASRGYRTLLLTTDPASHIGQVLDQELDDQIRAVEGVDNLYATVIDQRKASIEYKKRILQEAEGKYSPDMLAAIKEELESPCTEEMAAFDKFMHYVESNDYDLVIIDTAPTGHTLRLLELPFDYGQQVSMMVSTSEQSAAAKSVTQQRFERIIARMKDPRRSIFAFVVYPESTPVIEAYRAMLDLKEAGIETQLMVANQVLPEEVCNNDYFRRRHRMQQKYLREIKERFGVPVAVLPLLEGEIIGLDTVRRAGELLFAGSKRYSQKEEKVLI